MPKLLKGTKTILYLNIIIFIFMVIFKLIYKSVDILNIALSCWPLHNKFFNLYQLITHQFIHSGILHLICNMFVFVVVSKDVEEYLGIKKFYTYYLICGVLSAILQLSIIKDDVPLIGASGSIYGIYAIYVLVNIRKKISIFFTKIPMYIPLILIFISELCDAIRLNDNIAHLDHIGGIVTGLLLFQLNKVIK